MPMKASPGTGEAAIGPVCSIRGANPDNVNTMILRGRLRIAFVAYGGMNRKDWRTVSLDDVDFDNPELARQLRPTLRVRQP